LHCHFAALTEVKKIDYTKIKGVFPMTEEMWEAIITCDPTYDGSFFYGVKTTGIFCRPSCKSKNPKREHVLVFSSIQEAASANFRPCKRCRPTDLYLPDEELVQNAVELIECRYHETLTLQVLADQLHISPYHLHRTFKRITGHTPAEHIRTTRLTQAKKLLVETDQAITDIAMAVGFSNVGHFSTVFQKQCGFTPSAYRRQLDYTTK
jgi:AraC family transcriptional regulator of adaptative response / methylphosphotriester-DNA alkyltransferase methyltransferase